MVNPPLILVSALFFLALVSGLYLGSWMAASAFLRLRRGRPSHAAHKRLLLTALLFPPLVAGGLTLSGATLLHSHALPALTHHSEGCRQTFLRLLALRSLLDGGEAGSPAGLLVSGFSWALVLFGAALIGRLAWATLSLERGIAPYLLEASPRLAASVDRVSRCLKGLPALPFYECAIPMSYSSLLGGFRTRCVLSQDLVEAASDEELDAVVAHEACHLRMGDVRATFVVGLLNCLFFYLRPVRILSRRWREETELACDAAAVAATGQPLAMARAILKANGVRVSGASEAHPLPAVALAFSDEVVCSPAKRVEILLEKAQERSVPPSETALQMAFGWTISLLLAGVPILLMVSPEAACYVHCSLEAVALLPH